MNGGKEGREGGREEGREGGREEGRKEGRKEEYNHPNILHLSKPFHIHHAFDPTCPLREKKPQYFSVDRICKTRTQTQGAADRQRAASREECLFPHAPCSGAGLAPTHPHSPARSLCDQGPTLQAVQDPSDHAWSTPMPAFPQVPAQTQ